MNIPHGAEYILNTLADHGFEAYVVGGCVRDSLLGSAPDDWDICTCALPDDIINIFDHTIPTGLQHGTVTVIVDSCAYEVTTYRIDGKYTDSRRPDNVEFTRSLTEDLRRRDFTINAMAYSPTKGLFDPFGGQEDLKNGIIRCVGNPDERFSEDALRILRAWRFSCRLGFEIEQNTLKAAKQYSIQKVSSERICTEFLKTLACTKRFVSSTLSDDYFLSCIIPEWSSMNMSQNNPHHIYNISAHTLAALDSISDSGDMILKLAVLLHDIGKPHCYTEDEHGVGHFYNHDNIGADLADEIMHRLKFDNSTRIAVVELIRFHGAHINENSRSVKRWLGKIGEAQLLRLIALKRADTMGQNPKYIPERLAILENLENIIHSVIADNECFRIKDLAINGTDLINLGYTTGKTLGNTLSALLEAVISGEVQNDNKALSALAENMLIDEKNNI